MKKNKILLFGLSILLILSLFNILTYANDSETRYFQGYTNNEKPTFEIVFAESGVEVSQIELYEADDFPEGDPIFQEDSFEKSSEMDGKIGLFTLKDSLPSEGDYVLYIPEKGASTATGIIMPYDIVFSFSFSQKIPSFDTFYFPLGLENNRVYTNRRLLVGKSQANTDLTISLYDESNYVSENKVGEFSFSSSDYNTLFYENLDVEGYFVDGNLIYDVSDEPQITDDLSPLLDISNEVQNIWLKPDFKVVSKDCNSGDGYDSGNEEFLNCIKDTIINVESIYELDNEVIVELEDRTNLNYDYYDIYYENTSSNFLPSGFFSHELTDEVDNYFFHLFIEDIAGNRRELRELELFYDDESPSIVDSNPSGIKAGEISSLELEFNDSIKLNKDSFKIEFLEGNQSIDRFDVSFDCIKRDIECDLLEVLIDFDNILGEGYYEYEVYLEDMAGNSLVEILNFTRNDNIPHEPTIISEDVLNLKKNTLHIKMN
ncbi:MAG: hypothetical protein ACOCQD_01290 [archaeon]